MTPNGRPDRLDFFAVVIAVVATIATVYVLWPHAPKVEPPAPCPNCEPYAVIKAKIGEPFALEKGESYIVSISRAEDGLSVGQLFVADSQESLKSVEIQLTDKGRTAFNAGFAACRQCLEGEAIFGAKVNEKLEKCREEKWHGWKDGK